QWKKIAEQERDPEVDPDESRRDRRYLHLHETFDGMWAIEGLLDPEVGAALKETIDDLERRFHRQDVADARLELDTEPATAEADPDPDADRDGGTDPDADMDEDTL